MMNVITILLWITIAIIGAIAIILVKLHYKGDELEAEEGSILPNTGSLSGIIAQGKEKLSSGSNDNRLSSRSTQTNTKSLYGNRPRTASIGSDAYIVPEVEENNNVTYQYESENQVLINYGNDVKKFQEPIKQSQMDIMTQNKEDKTELKDLFTIDELIKESKRKDNEREKESQRTEEEDAELIELKESIKRRKEHPVEDPLIEEVVSENETIGDLIKDDEPQVGIASAISAEEEAPETETNTASQKDIEEAITSASQESEEEIESISEDSNITEVLLESESDDDSLDIPNEEIKEPTLKTPSKVSESKDTEFGAPIDDGMDLDYRKDLNRFTNKITGSKLFQDVKEKIITETEELRPKEDETYIRNVKEYDEYEPIINETHIDYETLHETDEQRLRKENTRRVFNNKKSPEPELAQPKVGEIKSKPIRDNIKINIGNAEYVLKKGDEIIFNHMGETYSSQVYAIKGDDIYVRYRRKDITIKPEDVKKVY
ncbi:MAG: hypothetical protein IKH29_03140 [Methanobrevibacter sp.]|uniref:hypothetical protein n=1 Tax=Methanobrevibacter sp. TaxID=66852 RepID=UPI0025FA2066|nr:hypothetical protein [Methanobrevibacter sp.]MBR3112692.1 hypothetical protein [Methanobrevibacter sp.]